MSNFDYVECSLRIANSCIFHCKLSSSISSLQILVIYELNKGIHQFSSLHGCRSVVRNLKDPYCLMRLVSFYDLYLRLLLLVLCRCWRYGSFRGRDESMIKVISSVSSSSEKYFWPFKSPVFERLFWNVLFDCDYDCDEFDRFCFGWNDFDMISLSFSMFWLFPEAFRLGK